MSRCIASLIRINSIFLCNQRRFVVVWLVFLSMLELPWHGNSSLIKRKRLFVILKSGLLWIQHIATSVLIPYPLPICSQLPCPSMILFLPHLPFLLFICLLAWNLLKLFSSIITGSMTMMPLLIPSRRSTNQWWRMKTGMTLFLYDTSKD